MPKRKIRASYVRLSDRTPRRPIPGGHGRGSDAPCEAADAVDKDGIPDNDATPVNCE